MISSTLSARNGGFWISSLLIGASLLAGASCANAEAPLVPGGKVVFNYPLAKKEIHWLKSARLTGYTEAEVSIALPAGFDGRKIYPILVTCVTGDRYLSNTAAMDKYWPIATEEGWVVVTGWLQPRPQYDKLLFRRAITVAAMRALNELLPASTDWPVATAGFSGGSKNAALMAAFLQKEGCRLAGIFMGGCNEDYGSVALRKYSPDEDLFRIVPIFLGNGTLDQISTLDDAKEVESSLRKSGFSRVRMKTYPGKHNLSSENLREALNWFKGFLDTGPPTTSPGAP